MNYHARGLYEQSTKLSEFLQRFSFSYNSTEPDPVIAVCGVQYLRLSQIQLSLVCV